MEEKKVRMCATCKHYRPTEGRCSLSDEPKSPILDCDRFEDWHGEEEPEGWEQMSLI